MSTLNLQVGASAGDANQGGGADDLGRAFVSTDAASITATTIAAGSHGINDEWSSGVRFTAVTIPNGATINSALLKVTAWNDYTVGGGKTIKYVISAQAADNPGVFTTGAGNLNTTNRPRSTAYVDWVHDSQVRDTEYSIDVTTLVQEIVNRGGWASGNALILLIDTHVDCTAAEWQDFFSYNDDPAKAPKLDIDYTAGAAPTRAGATRVVVAGGPGPGRMIGPMALVVNAPRQATATPTRAGFAAVYVAPPGPVSAPGPGQAVIVSAPRYVAAAVSERAGFGLVTVSDGPRGAVVVPAAVIVSAPRDGAVAAPDRAGIGFVTVSSSPAGPVIVPVPVVVNAPHYVELSLSGFVRVVVANVLPYPVIVPAPVIVLAPRRDDRRGGVGRVVTVAGLVVAAVRVGLGLVVRPRGPGPVASTLTANVYAALTADDVSAALVPDDASTVLIADDVTSVTGPAD